MDIETESILYMYTDVTNNVIVYKYVPRAMMVHLENTPMKAYMNNMSRWHSTFNHMQLSNFTNMPHSNVRIVFQHTHTTG